MDEKIISEIGSLIRTFNKSMQQHLPALEKEVNELIDSKSIDNNIIENTLDTLLSLTMHGIADDLFIKLLEYYKTIDTEGAIFYWNEYDKEEE